MTGKLLTIVICDPSGKSKSYGSEQSVHMRQKMELAGKSAGGEA